MPGSASARLLTTLVKNVKRCRASVAGSRARARDDRSCCQNQQLAPRPPTHPFPLVERHQRRCPHPHTPHYLQEGLEPAMKFSVPCEQFVASLGVAARGV